MASSFPLKSLSERKLQLLLAARERGETIDEAAVKKYTKAATSSRIAAYLEAVQTGKIPVPSPAYVPSDDSFVLVDDFGAETELEKVRETSTTTVLRRITAKPVLVVVKGRTLTVDLSRLRAMKPDDLHQGVKVSLLIAAAEIASP